MELNDGHTGSRHYVFNREIALPFGFQNCTRAIERLMFGTSKCAHAGVFFVGGSTAVSVWPNKINYYILCVGGGG